MNPQTSGYGQARETTVESKRRRSEDQSTNQPTDQSTNQGIEHTDKYVANYFINRTIIK